MAKESLGTVVKRRTQGVVFLAIVAALIGLSIAIYDKAFTPTVDVTMLANTTGNQLQEASDVKVNGLIVGSVGSVSVEHDPNYPANVNKTVAKVQLKLDPGMVNQIPSNVVAAILPKTLFGEQYVSLEIPTNPSGQHIQSGEVIEPDQSKGALEAQKVLGDLLPVLTAVQPAQLNATLTALATALNGRGEKLGETLVNLDHYLKILNSQSPTGNTYTGQLVDDLDKLGKVALEYNGVAPDLFASLQNLLTSANTVIQKRTELDQLLTAGSGASGVLSSFLSDNEQRIITVSGQTSKVFNTLAVYAPEYSCLFAGINQLYTKASNAIYNGAIHLSATVTAPDSTFGPYKKGEEPKLVTGYGPNCFGLPNNPTPVDSQGHFQIPAKYNCLNDGAALTKAGNSANCTATASSSNDSAINSPAEDAMVNSLIAGDLGTTPDKVPSSSTLLAGPLLRGQKVVVK